ncbi:MAG: NADH-quinone oxidoreductase subunit M, partial [Solirubrobacterales bacterium]
MILVWLLGITIIGAVAAWVAARWSPAACRWVSLIALIADAVLLILLFSRANADGTVRDSPWLFECAYSWIPSLGVSFHL